MGWPAPPAMEPRGLPRHVVDPFSALSADWCTIARAAVYGGPYVANVSVRNVLYLMKRSGHKGQTGEAGKQGPRCRQP